MEENLVIVESPAKATTIQRFLGDNFIVKSCFGHIRDLAKKNNGVEIGNNYSPIYEIPEEKKKLISDLTKLSKKAKTVWLASDEDREGEAIAWHLSEALNLSQNKTQRIVFHEITKAAIDAAIENPRSIDINLVNAQQARRILDRLVGFELSPLLWKKVKPSLSAGRVQSVAVRLIVERERDIQNFKSTSSYKVVGYFKIQNSGVKEFKADLNTKFNTKKEAFDFIEKCKSAIFTIEGVQTQPTKKSPAPPFTTSTLQQEAARKLGFSVSQTMTLAQKLYEAGHITYMRTDSVNLSNLALSTSANEIVSEFGKEYQKTRKYTTKSKGAQEAHEAIRPTYFNARNAGGSATEKKLYELIWKRAIASQMSDALLEKTTATINISTSGEKFIAIGEVLKFDGFLKVYIESSDDENEEDSARLPEMKKDDKLSFSKIVASEKFTHYPPRYTEASLVKKLEELGIGRPSTYAPTISTILAREYVIKEDRQGKERIYNVISLVDNTVSDESKTEIYGNEKAKLFPTDIGIIVNDFLVEYFKDILDYNFTAKVEEEFDEIAEGKIQWQKMIDTFYKPFHKKIEKTELVSEKSKGERLLGNDPATGKPVSVKIGRFGPMVQIGDSSDEDKPKFASLLKGQTLNTITLEEALDLFKLPREIGNHNGSVVSVGIGRFGPYVKHENKFYSIKKEDDPMTIDLQRAIQIINEKIDKDTKKVLKTFAEDAELTILNGRWGAYIAYKGSNFKLPKTPEIDKLTHKDCLEIIEKQKASKTKK